MAGKRHLFLGAGELDFASFFKNLNLDRVHALTIECDMPYRRDDANVSVQSMKLAYQFIESHLRHSR